MINFVGAGCGAVDLITLRGKRLIEEADIIGFANKMNLPVAKKHCPADGFTKREYVKNLLDQINRENPGVKDRMFTAITGSTIKGWKNGQHELS